MVQACAASCPCPQHACRHPRPLQHRGSFWPFPAPCALQHILVAPDKKDLIPQLRQRIEAGETLAALAAEHSQCPSRRCQGRGA